MTFITRLPTNFITPVIQRQRRVHHSLHVKPMHACLWNALYWSDTSNIFVAWQSCFPALFLSPALFHTPKFPRWISTLSRSSAWSSFSSLVTAFTPPKFLLFFTTPRRSQRFLNNCICYPVSLCRSQFAQTMTTGWVNLKFEQVVSPPSGLKSCSLSLELFQFPVRCYLNIWRFWSFWFICRKCRKILV